MEELWKPIAEFNRVYEVSNLGRVRSVERYINTRTYPAQIMKQLIGNNDCLMVQLRDGKKQYRRSVAKLVLTAFVGPAPAGSKQVRHIDGNTHNNVLHNLEWDVCKAQLLPENLDNVQLFNKQAEYYARKYIKTERLMGMCRRFGYFDENDVVQEALWKIWREIRLYDPKICAFSSFCFLRTRQALMRMYKKEVKKKTNILNLDIRDISEFLEG